MTSTLVASRDTITPLDVGEDSRLRTTNVSPLALATFICVASIVGVLAWLSLAGDKNGGQPRVLIALSPGGPLSAPEILLGSSHLSLERIPLPRQKPELDPLSDPTLSAQAPSASPWSSAEDLTGLRDPVAPQQTPAAATVPGPVAPAAAPSKPTNVALRPAPDPALIAQSASGPLPIIAKDGRTSMTVYARPFPVGDTRPRIAIVLRGLGLSQNATKAAIADLPPEITLSFVPYPDSLQSWVNKSRAAGHEVMLEVPMEPFDFPNNDPGPFTLLTQLSANDNIIRLEWLLSRFSGYVGVTNYLGAKFTTTPEAFAPVLKDIKDRGLLYLGEGKPQNKQLAAAGRAFGLTWTASDKSLNYGSASSVDIDLLKLESLARENRMAVGTSFAFPVVIKQIAAWAKTLEQKGIALAPLSAVALNQRLQ